MEKDPHKKLGMRIAGQVRIFADRLNKISLSVFNLSWLVIAEDLKDYIRTSRPLPKERLNEIMILANGPSLKDTLADIRSGKLEWKGKDSFFVNYLALDDVFMLMKPKHYCLSDPQFFMDGYPNSERGKQLLKHLAHATDWDMNIYVPYVFKDSAKLVDTNPHLKIIPFHTVPCLGTDGLRRWMFRKGLANGEYGTVVQNAIYVSVHLGFSKLHLYGVDHNFFDNLTLNDDNVLCSRTSHFYDTGKPELTPVRVAKGTMRVDEFLGYYSELFRGYFVLKEYADACGCEILNHTRNSLIDAFRRV